MGHRGGKRIRVRKGGGPAPSRGRTTLAALSTIGLFRERKGAASIDGAGGVYGGRVYRLEVVLLSFSFSRRERREG